MIDSLTQDNASDFKARYSGTIGFYLTDSGKRVVYIQSVDSQRATFVDEMKQQYHATADGGGQFEFIQVQGGWFNGLNNTYFLQRIPARQWHRGICSSNTSCWVLRGKYPETFLISVALISELFPGSVYVRDAIIDYLIGKRPAVALSKHFAVSKTALYLYDKSIGTVNHTQDRMTLTLNDNMFSQELQDMIRRNSFERMIEIGNR